MVMTASDPLVNSCMHDIVKMNKFGEEMYKFR